MAGTFDPTLSRRRSIRLQGHWYDAPGDYFVTLCVERRRTLLGEIRDRTMHANAVGTMIRMEWEALRTFSDYVQLGAFVIMPNHLHGIITIRAGPEDAKCQSLGSIIGRFKSLTTIRHARLVEADGRGLPIVCLWQRNYYEHIIRSSEEFNGISKYIADNPLNWRHDPENRPWGTPNP